MTLSSPQYILANVLFGKIVHDMEIDFDMIAKKKADFRCLKIAHARDFVIAIH
jgi:hypothetical protein